MPNNYSTFFWIQLSVNWFQPHEPSIKRSAIQRLISNLLKNLSLENSPSCASDSCFPEGGLKTSNYDENAVELVSEQFRSSKSSDNLPCSQANEINPFPTSSLRGVCASDSGLVLNESFEPESDEESLLDMRFGHSASFNEFRSSLPPIQVCCYISATSLIVLKLVDINMKISTYGYNVIFRSWSSSLSYFLSLCPFLLVSNEKEGGAIFYEQYTDYWCIT